MFHYSKLDGSGDVGNVEEEVSSLIKNNNLRQVGASSFDFDSNFNFNFNFDQKLVADFFF